MSIHNSYNGVLFIPYKCKFCNYFIDHTSRVYFFKDKCYCSLFCLSNINSFKKLCKSLNGNNM